MAKSLTAKIKEAGLHSVIYGMGGMLQKAVGFFLIPVYTKHYTTEMYGTLALLSIVGVIAGSVFYLGVHSALSRSYFDYPAGEQRKAVATTTLFILLCGAFIQVVLGLFFKNQISIILFNTTAYSMHVLLVLMTSAIGFIKNLFYMLLRFERKSMTVALLNIVQLLINIPLILFFLIKMGYGVMAPILAHFIVAIILFVILFWQTHKQLTLRINKNEIPVQLKWGVSIVIANFGVMALNWSDRFFIKEYCSLSDVGVYSMGYQIGMMVNLLLIKPFMLIYNPMRMEYRNDDNAQEFFKKMFSYFLIIGLVICTGLSVFSKDLLSFMSSRPEYVEAYKVVPWIAFAYLVVGLKGLTINGILFARKVYYSAYFSWIAAILNITLNVILIPVYGFMVAAYTTLGAFIITWPIGIIVSQKHYKQNYEIGRIVVLTALAVVVVIVSNTATFNALLSKIALFSLFIVLIFSQLNRKEKQSLLKLRLQKPLND